MRRRRLQPVDDPEDAALPCPACGRGSCRCGEADPEATPWEDPWMSWSAAVAMNA